jgi:DNA-binding GntR family transcriptional regulator
MIPGVPAATKRGLNKQEHAYKLIRGRIESGEYGPGQRVIIDSLSREFGISQVPIREAIRRLEAAGWIVYHRNTGPVVAPATRERWEAGMEVLAVAEGYATGLAAPHFTPPDIANLQRINKAMGKSLKALDLLEFSHGNREFHACIYRRCPNHYLVEQLIEIQAQLDAVRGTVFTNLPQRGMTSIKEHDELIRALQQRKPVDQIERLAREHKMNTVRAARASMGQPRDLDIA